MADLVYGSPSFVNDATFQSGAVMGGRLDMGGNAFVLDQVSDPDTFIDHGGTDTINFWTGNLLGLQIIRGTPNRLSLSQSFRLEWSGGARFISDGSGRLGIWNSSNQGPRFTVGNRSLIMESQDFADDLVLGLRGRLQVGGTTAAWPGLTANGTTLEVRLADNSALTAIAASDFNLGAGGSLATHAARHAGAGGDAITSLGAVTMTGLLTLSGAPTNDAHAATKLYVDNSIAGLDWQNSVLDKDLLTPPVSPTTGDRYIVAGAGGTATGAWATHEEKVTVWNGASWDFIVPNLGFATLAEDENNQYTYNGAHPAGTWVLFSTSIGSHALGGSQHTADTLANLNLLVSDATLIDTGDARLSDARVPLAHDLGGAEHNADTLANLNLKVSDATLVDTGDARFSDDRTASGLRSATTVVGVSAATAPTVGQVLTATSGTAATWQAAAGGGGDVTKVGTPVNNQIGVWTGDGTLEGDSSLIWTGTGLGVNETTPLSPLHVTDNGTASTQVVLIEQDDHNPYALKFRNSFAGAGDAFAIISNTGEFYLMSQSTKPMGIGRNTGSGNTDDLVIDSTGNVGIGTNTPAVDLEVERDVNAGVQIFADNRNGGNAAFSSFVSHVDSAAMQMQLNTKSTTFAGSLDGLNYASTVQLLANGASGGLWIHNDATTGPIHFLTNSLLAMTIDSSQNVGIGIIPTTGKLHVLGEGSNATVLRLEQPDSNSVWMQFASTTRTWTVGQNASDGFTIQNGVGICFNIEDIAPANSFYIDSTGLVALGTNNPVHDLEITKTPLINIPVSFAVQNNQTTGTTTDARIIVNANTGGDAFLQLRTINSGAKFWTIANDNTGTNVGALTFATGSTPSSGIVMTLNQAGNVGIGPTAFNAAHRLVVEGNAHISGQIFQGAITTYTPTGTTQTVDWDNGNVQTVDLESATGNVTLTLNNPEIGATYIVKVIQDSAIARDILWPVVVLWQGGTPPVISTTLNGFDVITLLWDGTNYLGNFGQDYQ